MNNAELDTKTIERQLGHYNIQFARKVYMNAQDKQVDREMEKLETYLAVI